MGYVIVGSVCFIVGAWVGVFTLALVSINKSTEWAEFEKTTAPEEVQQDADR